MNTNPSLKSIIIKGFKPFGTFEANFNPLEVIIGANGSGKSSLFEFLRFLRDSLNYGIPPEIIKGSIGQQIFHNLSNEKISWNLKVNGLQKASLEYEGELMGPIGNPRIISEQIRTSKSKQNNPYSFLENKSGKGYIRDIKGEEQQEFGPINKNRLALSIIANPKMTNLYKLGEYILKWRFYSSLNIDNEKIRRPTLTEQDPILHEDAGNLSSLLHYLMTQHNDVFSKLQLVLKLAIPKFNKLSIKPYGGLGNIMGFWKEGGVDDGLSLADLSDGILRFISWAVICLHPSPPPLICIDEPELGLHPRTLPILAGLFEKACERTQILLATHSSYLIKQFDISQIAVMRKENGEAKYLKPANSKILIQNLEDFGQEEIEIMHQSDELETLA